jgi:hypothetical protein
VIKSDIFKDELIARNQTLPPRQSDTHGVVQLGTNFPLVRFGAITLSLQGGLISRFRLDTSDNDALSSDYVVAFPFNFKHGANEARIRLIHRSAHLGDELVLNSGFRRLEFDHEEIDGLYARSVGPFRVYTGGTVTLASSFEKDKWGIQAGADGRWRLGRNSAAVAGIDWQRHTINEGSSRIGGAAGLEWSGPAGKLALHAVFQSGASAMGEFFLERESYRGFEVVLQH